MFFRKLFGLDESNDSKFTEKTPAFVKVQEEKRINPFYTNITLGQTNNQDVKLARTVPYIWIYTSKQEVIIGVEEPWKYPDAVAVDPENPLAMIEFKKRMTSTEEWQPLPLGHPTLSAEFAIKGAAKNSTGTAYIGGMLVYVGHQWQLNNMSGRFGIVENNVTDALELMRAVAVEVNKLLPVKEKVHIRLSLPQFPYLNYYYEIWDRGKSDYTSTLYLLINYLRLGNPFPPESFAAAKAVKITVDKYGRKHQNFKPSAHDVLQFLLLQLEGSNATLDDSLLLRLQFIAGQTGSKLDITRISHNKTLVNDDPLVRNAEADNRPRSPR